MKRSASIFSRLLSLLLVLIAIAVPSFAQTATGSIRGIIYDQSKAIINKAKVTATNKATGAERTAESNSTGEYIFSALPPGEYDVKVTVSGFKVSLTSLTLQVGESVTNDFSLEVGRANETVVISSEAPAINTTEYKIDGVVNRKQIDNLPLNGRNFLQLALLEPGVEVESRADTGTSPNNFFRVSVAGASQAMTRISVDGATINDRVTGGTSQNFSQETVQEFQLSSFNFDPSTSTTSVGSINVVSRSGTNDYHGSGFIYFRDHNMAAFPGLERDSRRFIDPSRDDPFFARRQTGGSVGGPIKKDSLFWFFNMEHNNQDGVFAINNGKHPIFSQFDVVSPNPLTATQANLRIDIPKLTSKNSAFIRLSNDHNDNFNPANGVFLPSNWVASKNVAAQGLVGLTTVFTPKLVNDFRFSHGFFSNKLKIPTTDDCRDPIACIGLGGIQIRTTLSDFRIGNNLNTPQNRVLRTYQFTDNVSYQKGEHRIRFGGEWEHHYGVGHWAYLEPGIMVLWDPLHLAALAPPLFNALPATLKSPAAGRPSYADLLRLPIFDIFTGIGDPGQPQNYRQPQASRNDRYRLHLSDQWRVTPRFTFSYGVSYSYEDNLLNHDLDRPAYLAPLLGGDLRSPKRDKNNFDPTIGFAWDVGGNQKTVIRGGGGIYHDSNVFWTRLVERAYTGPTGNGRYIIPGSAFPTRSDNRSLQNPFLTGQVILGQLPAIRNGLSTFIGDGSNLSVRGAERIKTTGDAGFGGIFDPNTVTGYAANMSVGVQREMAQNLVLQADFVMRRSIHFGGLHNTFIYDRNHFNRASISAVNPVTGRGSTITSPIIPLCTGAQALNPNAQCSQGIISVSESSANYRYTALHVKVDKRFSTAYQFTASYALSKFTGFNGFGNGAVSLDDHFAGDGYQGSDRRHRFTFSGIVEAPKYGGDNKLLRGLFNTWQFSLISQIMSKPPLSATVSSVDLDGDGTDNSLLPGVAFNGFGRGVGKNELRNLVDQFNKNFSTAATGKRTTRDQVIPALFLPPNFDNGDNYFSQDVRLSRLITIRENFKLTLIGEVFNIFNISNLSGYGASLDPLAAPGQQQAITFGQPSGRIGQVFGSGGPRAFQLAVKFTF